MVKTPVKKTSPKRRRPGQLIQNLLRRFGDKPVRPSEVRLKVMSKYTSKSTSSGVKITRNRWAQLEQNSSSSEEMEQRTLRKSSRKGEKDKGEREKKHQLEG